MSDGKKYDGSSNPFDDPDEVVPESAQKYTNLHLPPQPNQNHNTSLSKDNNQVNNNKYNNNSKNATKANIQPTSKYNSKNKDYHDKNENDKPKFLQKTENGVNTVLTATSDHVGKPIISFSQKMNTKITKWLNI